MTDQEKDEIFASSADWAVDRELRDRRSLRMAWAITGFSVVLSVLLVIALIILLPLKREEPIALLVDKTTGFVQRVDPTAGNTIRADDAMLQSLLAQYVVAREGFDRASIQGDYRKTALWSSGDARTAYQATFNAGTGNNPLERLGPNARVRVSVKSVSMIETGSAFVRFETQVLDSGGIASPSNSWISLVKFRFSDAEMSYEDRLLNPLGLQVYSYRRDPERPQAEGFSGLGQAAPPQARPLLYQDSPSFEVPAAEGDDSNNAP